MRLPHRLTILPFVLALAGCQPPMSSADRATVAACQTRANQVYETQNRAAIFLPAPSGNTPFSTDYQAGNTDGLSALHAHEDMVSNCVRYTGTQPLPKP